MDYRPPWQKIARTPMGTGTYFDYFGFTSLFNLALEAKRDRKRKFLRYYSYPFTSFGKIFLTLIHAFRGVAS